MKKIISISLVAAAGLAMSSIALSGGGASREASWLIQTD